MRGSRAPRALEQTLEPAIPVANRSHRQGATVLLALPFAIGGGAERMLSGVAASLAARGHRVLAVTTRATPFGYGDRSAWFRRAGVELHPLPGALPERNWLAFLDRMIVTDGVDVLWQTGSDYVYRALGELRRRHARLRVVDSLFSVSAHVRRHLELRDLIDIAAVESDVVRDALISGGADPRRIVTIPNGVDTERFRPREAAPAGAAARAARQLNAGFVGRLAQEKDPLAFVALAAACRDLPIRFHLAGEGPLSGAVRRSARRRGLGDSLVLHGFRDDIERLYVELDVLVVPSRSDGRPNVALEALATGVPVLASPVGALPGLVDDGLNGFLCASVPAFAERLGWLCDHPERRASMGAAARGTAVRELGAGVTHRGYDLVMRGLVSDRAEALADA